MLRGVFTDRDPEETRDLDIIMRHALLVVMFTWLALSAEGFVHKLSASTRAAPNLWSLSAWEPRSS